jgi:chromatin remodeling complex protein RSC6
MPVRIVPRLCVCTVLGNRSDKAKSSKGSSKRASQFGSGLSPEMQAFLGVESLPRTQVVKRIWEYVKGKGLQVSNQQVVNRGF